MLRITGIVVLFVLLTGPAMSQENYIREGRDGIYQIFLGDAVFGNEQDVFADARKYGFFRPFSIAEDSKEAAGDKSPIFLGPYLGRGTAEYVLGKLRGLGYEQAYIEGDEVRLTTGKGSNLTHSVQLGAYESLNAALFAPFANQPAGGIVILYEDGLLKLLGGLYPASSEAYLKDFAVNYWKESIGANVFVRPFRNPFRD